MDTRARSLVFLLCIAGWTTATEELTTELTTEVSTVITTEVSTVAVEEPEPLPPAEELLSMSPREILAFFGDDAVECFFEMLDTKYPWLEVKGFVYINCACFTPDVNCDGDEDEIVEEIFKALDKLNKEVPNEIEWDKIRVRASTVTYAVCGLLGIIGNVLVILTILLVLKLTSVTNLYVFNLAIADLLVCVYVIPMESYRIMNSKFLLPNAVCKLNFYLLYAMCFVSIITMTFMAFERFIVIVLPMKAKTWTTMTRASITVAITWPLGLGLSIPLIFVAGIMKGSGGICELSDFEDINTVGILFAYLLTVMFLLPSALIGFFYIYTAVTLWGSIKTSMAMKAGGEGKGSDEKSNEAKSRLAVIRMLILVWVVFMVCWGPYLITETILRNSSVIELTWEQFRSMQDTAFRLMTIVNSALNPLLYFIMSRQFRGGFIQVITCYKVKPKKAGSSVVSSSGATRSTAASTAVTSVSKG